jgi:hypothetical protein
MRAYVALAFAPISWGVGAAMAKYAVGPLAAFTTLIIELFAASLVLWAAMARRPAGQSDPAAPVPAGRAAVLHCPGARAAAAERGDQPAPRSSSSANGSASRRSPAAR